ncbi:hypothetical protein ACF0H5_014965 [Mactra antiquata]
MSHIGFNYENYKISKHQDMDEKEKEEIFDYRNGTCTRKTRQAHDHNKQTGSNWSVGLGYFPKPKPALKEGSTKLAISDGPSRSNRMCIGPRYASRDVNPKISGDGSDEEETEEIIGKDPERPNLLYKRTRTRKRTGKVGDHVSQSQFEFGIKW